MRYLTAVFALSFGLAAQVIEFESGGLKYQTLTRNGLTVMFAQLPSHVREYSILQVAISNGSKTVCVLKPEDFIFYKSDGEAVHAVPAGVVVGNLVEKASRHDVIKLVVAYEGGIYGNSKLKSTNGYEVRRQNALGEVGSPKIKAAAAASAIAFVNTRLQPGESTDGAVFYSNAGKPLGAGKLVLKTSGGTFEFPMVSSN